MARDAKKRQKQLKKKAAKRKQKRSIVSKQSIAKAAPSLSRTKEWPLEAAWVTADWQQPEQIIQTLFLRRGPHGHVALGNVLVDTMCLGVKNAYGRITNELEYNETLKMMQGNQEMVAADTNLIAKIVRESVAYARELGFQPNKDLKQAMIVLGDADPDACSVDIPLGGPDGRPYFFAGPHDNVDRIMKTLTKKLGPDGFTYMIGMETLDNDEMFFADSVEFDDDSLEDDHSGKTIALADEDYKVVD